MELLDIEVGKKGFLRYNIPQKENGFYTKNELKKLVLKAKREIRTDFGKEYTVGVSVKASNKNSHQPKYKNQKVIWNSTEQRELFQAVEIPDIYHGRILQASIFFVPK